MSAIKDLKNQLTLANKMFKNAKYEEAIEAYGDIIVDERLSAILAITTEQRICDFAV